MRRWLKILLKITEELAEMNRNIELKREMSPPKILVSAITDYGHLVEAFI